MLADAATSTVCRRQVTRSLGNVPVTLSAPPEASGSVRCGLLRSAMNDRCAVDGTQSAGWWLRGGVEVGGFLSGSRVERVLGCRILLPGLGRGPGHGGQGHGEHGSGDPGKCCSSGEGKEHDQRV